jgi:hypothetical protein
MVKTCTVYILLVVLAIILLYSAELQKIVTVSRVCVESFSCSSFLQWAQMVQRQDYITIKDHTREKVDTPSEPHFILGNHISSHFSMGTFITIADTIKSPTNVVCYVSYNNLWFVNSTIHKVLENEIKIDSKCSHSEKEQSMVEGIRNAFAAGHNVMMFLDAHKPRMTMHTLNKVVLEQFPEYKKQLVHIFEPSENNEFGYRRYHATYDLTDIQRDRTEIVGRKYLNQSVPKT